jgi:hypothetical protein
MRRWVSIAAFVLILLSLPMWAQRHGGVGGHVASGAGFAGHSSGSFHGGNPTHSSTIHLRIGNPFFRPRVYNRRFLYPYAPYYPYFGYDGGYDPPGYQTQDSYGDSYSPAPSSQVPYRDDGLQRDVEALSGKIDRLQADVEARNKKPEMEPATALVFRDQHVEEVHNYAIAGATLWVLNDKAAKKIPLAQLDLAATVKMNGDRGIDFQVPGPSLQLMIVR